MEKKKKTKRCVERQKGVVFGPQVKGEAVEEGHAFLCSRSEGEDVGRFEI